MVLTEMKTCSDFASSIYPNKSLTVLIDDLRNNFPQRHSFASSAMYKNETLNHCANAMVDLNTIHDTITSCNSEFNGQVRSKLPEIKTKGCELYRMCDKVNLWGKDGRTHRFQAVGAEKVQKRAKFGQMMDKTLPKPEWFCQK